MSLWGVLSNSAQAMMAQTTGLGTISENIANISTNGFKKVDAGFKTLLSESTVQHDFFTAKPALTRRVDVQGQVLSTGNSYDLAINGRGLFILNTELDGTGQSRYTRDGGFHTLANDVTGDGTKDSQLVTKEGYAVMGIAANTDGTFTAPTTETGLVPVVVRDESVNSGVATSELTIRANVDAATTDTQPFSLPVYNSSFVTKNLSMQWEPSTTTPNEWTLTFDMAAADGTVTSPAASATTVTFNSDGELPSGTTYTVPVAITWADASTSTVTIDYSEMQQLAKPSNLQSLSQNGHAAGQLQSTYFDEKGILYYSYSNGVITPKYQIPVATFPAPNHLTHMNGNTYAESPESGSSTVATGAAVGGLTRFEPNSVEISNVDIGDEFTRMMITQKAYSMAATVFKTGDEMVQVGRDLIR